MYLLDASESLGIPHVMDKACPRFSLPSLDVSSSQSSDPPDDRFACDICGKYFAQKAHQNRHMKAVHRLGRVIQCPLCDEYKTFRKDTLRQHLHHGHRLGAQDICPLCGLNHYHVVAHVLEVHL